MKVRFIMYDLRKLSKENPVSSSSNEASFLDVKSISSSIQILIQHPIAVPRMDMLAGRI